MATNKVLVAARVRSDFSTAWLLDVWDRLGTPKRPGKVSIGKLTRECIRTSGLLLDEGDPIIIAWELPWNNVRPSNSYLRECMRTLGVAREEIVSAVLTIRSPPDPHWYTGATLRTAL